MLKNSTFLLYKSIYRKEIQKNNALQKTKLHNRHSQHNKNYSQKKKKKMQF